MGDGTTTNRLTPVDVTGLASGVIALAAGGYHTCAVITGGAAKCWGFNGYGQLGDGTTNSRYTPVDVAGLTSGVAALVAGVYHTCAVTTGGGAKCWGANWLGQLGDNSTTQRLTPVDVSGLTGLTVTVTALAAGGGHTCAVITGGAAKCWGYNDYGQLGDGTTNSRYTPVDVAGLTSGVTALAAGVHHTCAVTTGGGAKCWGDNFYGQLGGGTATQHNTPVDVSGLTGGVAALAAGGYHTCAVTSGGGAKCWGRNEYGQLGDGITTRRTIPMAVTGLTGGITALAASDYHTCAVTTGGGAKCWGRNFYGQLGDGTTANRSTPVDVSGLTGGVAALAAGEYHTCAVTTGGGAKCWGANCGGELGDGTTDSRTTPVDVNGLTGGVAALAAGGQHTCAVTTGGGAKCWGANYYGQLGDGTFTQRLTPVDVTGLTGVTALAAAGGHTCALTTGGGVKCWGRNQYDQLGGGTATQHNTPVDVTGLTGGVAALAAGYGHTCALTTSGGVKCWGRNEYGQLGDGTFTQRLTPVDVSGLTSGVAALAAGGGHTCALTTGGAVKCWGTNWSGQLGDGTFTQKLTPVAVSGLAGGATALAAGWRHTCALVGAGRPKCWGDDESGQLGLGTATYRLTPVDVVASVPASLSLNYATGQPGTLFTLTGVNFPVSATLSITVNGVTLTDTLSVNPTGGFIYFLDTTAADTGFYQVTAHASPNVSASAGLFMAASAPLHAPEGGGLTLAVPGGVGQWQVHLPLVHR